MRQLHKIQLQILKKLLFTNSLRYTDLKPNDGIENSQYDFHLDQLISINYIQKVDHHYSLTIIGKEYANRLNTERMVIEKQAKITVIVAPARTINNKRQYLIYTRLKHPFFNCQGFLGGKVQYGEKVEDAAQRELKEETNLEGKPIITSIRHYRVIDETSGNLVEDKLMFFCLVENPKGEVIVGEEGNFEWVDEDQLFNYVTNHFEGPNEFERDLNEFKEFKGQIKFLEIDHYSNKF